MTYEELEQAFINERKARLKLRSLALKVHRSSSEQHISGSAYDVVQETDKLVHGNTPGYESIDSETAK